MTSSASVPAAEATLRDLVRDHVRAHVESLQRRYRGEDPSARVELAALRSAVQGKVGADPGAYRAAFDGADLRLVGSGDLPSPGERAVHLAMCLFAVHQQSGRDRSSHQRGQTFGSAVGRLARPDDAESREKPVMRRFNALLTATHMAEFEYHLSGLVRQFQSAEPAISLDYGLLAVDLFDLQRPASRDSARLRWSRDAIARTRGASTEQADA